MAIGTGTLLDHERSARRGLTWWAMLLVGAGFVYTAYTIDPLENCDKAGECAPWLVPVAGIMGWCATALALSRLLVNPRCGCRIDAVSGDLLWWKNRTLQSAGDMGRINPADIARIRLDRSDENDSVSLYGKDGERLHFFDEELLPWPYDLWIERFRQSYPHIQIDRLA